MQRAKAIESRIESHVGEAPYAATPEEFTGLAEQLHTVWNDPHTDAALKANRTVPRRRRGYNNGHTDKGLVEAVSMLARICTDAVLAGVLNRNGQRTGRGNRWTKERVTALRSHHRIPRYNPEACETSDWMNLTDAAEFLHVSPRTMRLAVEAGELRADHPLSEDPGSSVARNSY